MSALWAWPNSDRTRDPYYEDRGRSAPWTYWHNGTQRTSPARWSARWIRSLSDDEFSALHSALCDEDYWSCMNLRTLNARKQLAYRELVFRSPDRVSPSKGEATK